MKDEKWDLSPGAVDETPVCSKLHDSQDNGCEEPDRTQTQSHPAARQDDEVHDAKGNQKEPRAQTAETKPGSKPIEAHQDRWRIPVEPVGTNQNTESRTLPRDRRVEVGTRLVPSDLIAGSPGHATFQCGSNIDAQHKHL